MKQLFIALSLLCCIATAHAQWNTTGNTATSTNFLGTTNNIPLRFRTNNVQRMIIDSLGRIGVGIAFPRQLFTVQSSGTVPAASWITSGAPVFAGYGEGAAGNADFNLLMASSTAVNARGVFGMKRSRGTLAAPTAVLNNDQLGSLLVSGYDGTNFQGAAAVDFFADGTPTAGNVPVRISFVTGTNSTTRAERLRIGNTGDIAMNANQFFLQRSSGNLGIGTITPTAKLEVAGQVKITGGAPGDAKVLTSDADGLASWQAIPAPVETDPKVSASTLNKVPRWNGTTLTDGSITDNGNVGIGEPNPQGRLHVSEPFAFSGVAFAGTGLNDLTANVAGYTGSGTTTYIIRIQNSGPDPNLIEISNNGGATFESPIAISNPVLLANGVTATFAATGGHTFGDQWTFTVGPNFINALVVKSGKTGIGTASPDATLHIAGNVKIADGTQGAGKILTSDSNGVASWKNAGALTESDPKVATVTNGAVPKWNGTALTDGLIYDNGLNMGVGVTSPNASALLHLNSNNKGVLFPQVSIDSLKDVTSIPNPANGLVVYNTTQPGVRNDMARGYYYYSTNASSWVRLADNLNDNKWQDGGLGIQLRNKANGVDIMDDYTGGAINWAPKVKILKMMDSALLNSKNNINALVLTGVNRKVTAGWEPRQKTSLIFENAYITQSGAAFGTNTVAISAYTENAGTTTSNLTNGLGFYTFATPVNTATADTPSLSMFRHNVGIGAYVTDINNVAEGRLQITGLNNSDQLSLRHPSSINLKWGFYVSTIDSSLNFYSNGSLRSNIDRVTGVYTALSDRNLKKNIETLQPVLPIINKLTPYIYNYKDSRDGDRKAIGFMAQDVEPYFPDLVFDKKDRVTGEPFKMMTYQSFGVIAIKAIQEQQQQLAEKDARLKALEEKADSQQKQIDELKAALLQLSAQKTPCTTSK